MKTIIKTSLVALALLVSVGASAQLPVSFGVKAGANLSNLSEGDMDAKVGFNVGITADINVAPSLYVLTGLELTTKGAKYDAEVLGIKSSVTLNPMYLQLPIHVGYKLEVVPGTNIVFRAGPYLAYGLGGKSTVKVAGEKQKNDFFGDDGADRFDFGIGGGVGAEFGKISATLGYDFGLTKLWDADGAPKNRNAYLSLGYRF